MRQRSGGRLTLAWDQYADLGDAFDVTAVVVVNDHAVALINNGTDWRGEYLGPNGRADVVSRRRKPAKEGP